jgi:hypothetical protein
VSRRPILLAHAATTRLIETPVRRLPFTALVAVHEKRTLSRASRVDPPLQGLECGCGKSHRDAFGPAFPQHENDLAFGIEMLKVERDSLGPT